jgi:hypothetical protein
MVDKLEHQGTNWSVFCGDVLQWASFYSGPLFHALLCDPPYHLDTITKRFGKKGSAPAKYGKDGVYARASRGFMGKEWDSDIAFHPEVWAALGELLYPGAFGMAFSGSRTFHRIAVAIEDAGFIIHPMIGWVYGQGFPKATRIDNQIDKMAGAEREVVGQKKLWGHNAGTGAGSFSKNQYEGTTGVVRYEPITAPATELAQAWKGHRYGLQALKPAIEPIIVFQKPYDGKPIESMVDTGAGALWIDGGRIPVNVGKDDPRLGGKGDWATDKAAKNIYEGGYEGKRVASSPNGRWPANFILCHHPECRIVGQADADGYVINRFTDGAKPFGEGAGHEFETEKIDGGLVDVWECHPDCPILTLKGQSGKLKSGKMKQHINGGQFNVYGKHYPRFAETIGDSGTAARYFAQVDWSYEIVEGLLNADSFLYQAKAAPKERDAGLLGTHPCVKCGELNTKSHINPKTGKSEKCRRCDHPTVKPITLAQYLAKLLLPPDIYTPRRLLVPFSGVMSEAIGAMLVGWEEIQCVELMQEYVDIGETRMRWWQMRAEEKDEIDPKLLLKGVK